MVETDINIIRIPSSFDTGDYVCRNLFKL